MSTKLGKSVPVAIGTLLNVLSVLFLVEFVRLLDLDLEFIESSFSNWTEFLPYLSIGLLLGVLGIPIFIAGLSELDGSTLLEARVSHTVRDR